LVLSFPSEDARDRVAAELAAETATGLTPDAAAAPAAGPDADAAPIPTEEDR
jgi:hypothetical protein